MVLGEGALSYERGTPGVEYGTKLESVRRDVLEEGFWGARNPL